MRKFRTHLILSLKDSKIVNRLNFANSEFNLELSPEPTNRYWENNNSRFQMFYTGGKDKDDNPEDPEFPTE